MRSDTTPADLLHAARHDVDALEGPLRVAFDTCSYDTHFEPIEKQVDTRIEQLIDMYGVDGPVHWSLWVVDDLPQSRGFGQAAEAAMRRRTTLYASGRLRCVPLTGGARRVGGLKGRALLDGMAMALASDATIDVVGYLNLNLKVDLRLSSMGLALIQRGDCAAAIGSRAERDGGLVIGAGRLGRMKSRIYGAMARWALPPLASFIDTNAPMKLFTRRACEALVQTAQIEQVTLDCEWLMIMHAQGFTMRRFPVAWIQRPGSRPPWHLVPLSVRDIYRTRRRWRHGEFSASREP